MKRPALALTFALACHLAGAAGIWRAGRANGESSTSPRWVAVQAHENAPASQKKSRNSESAHSVRPAESVPLAANTPTTDSGETTAPHFGAGVPSSPADSPSGQAPRGTPTAPELQALRDRIEAKVRYPFSLRRLGIQGRSLVTVTLRADGAAEDIRISTSSGSADLDQLALDAVNDALNDPVPFPPLSRPLSFVLPIEFRTSDSSR